MVKEKLTDRLELELTHDGKFVSARSALLRSEGGGTVM
jgi:hypothetical protein